MFFSIRRFISDVCIGGCCFICGAKPSQAEFNDEHVLPDWLLRMFALHGRRITLPNLSSFQYGRYTIPCCITCNAAMGRRFESPIREAVTGGYAALRAHLDRSGPALLYAWLSLIFLKTHLRDRAFRVHRDLRKPDTKIADWYEWEELHHVHCVARSFHTRALWTPGIVGSMLVMKASTDMGDELFDYADLYAARTMLLRINDICIVAVMNDSGMVLPFIQGAVLRKIDAPPAGIQLRELMARCALLNLKIRERPTFRTAINERGEVALFADPPTQSPRVGKILKKEFGLMLYGALLPFVTDLRDQHGKALSTRVKRGQISFLFNSEGQFIKEPFVPVGNPP